MWRHHLIKDTKIDSCACNYTFSKEWCSGNTTKLLSKSFLTLNVKHLFKKPCTVCFQKKHLRFRNGAGDTLSTPWWWGGGHNRPAEDTTQTNNKHVQHQWFSLWNNRWVVQLLVNQLVLKKQYNYLYSGHRPSHVFLRDKWEQTFHWNTIISLSD